MKIYGKKKLFLLFKNNLLNLIKELYFKNKKGNYPSLS